jgi:hypothetical protein
MPHTYEGPGISHKFVFGKKEIFNEKLHQLNPKLVMFWRFLLLVLQMAIRNHSSIMSSKKMGGWGQIMANFDDLQYCKSSKWWVGGPKKVKNMMT